MTTRNLLKKMLAHEQFNFLITNRIPRLLLTQLIGRISKIRTPWFVKLSLSIWRYFGDLKLEESPQIQFDSIHDCFVRPIKPELRPIDRAPNCWCSPCDGMLGEFGIVESGMLYQAKGFPYCMNELMGPEDSQAWEGGIYVTIRITANMYHRFHAPADGRLTRLRYFSGDTWNVNPIALKRVEKLFCRNERVWMKFEVDQSDHALAMVAVAAVLVASVRLHDLDLLYHLNFKGPDAQECNVSYWKGKEMGWFEHGSTIILFAPPGSKLVSGLSVGSELKVGQALLIKPQQ